MRRAAALTAGGALVAALCASSARASPPDAFVTVAPGGDRFVRAPFAVNAVVVDPPDLANAEFFETNEVFIEARRAGSGVVLAAGPGRVFVWALCVAESEQGCPRRTSIDEAKSACPDLAHGQEDGAPVVTATIANEKCLGALREALSRESISADKLRLLMDENGLAALVRRVNEGIARDPGARGLAAGYMGATLRLKGRATAQAVARALLVAWRETPGRVSWEDRVELLPPEPRGGRADAGTSPAAPPPATNPPASNTVRESPAIRESPADRESP